MKLNQFALVGLMLLGALTCTQPVRSQDAQSTASPQQNDVRAAVARINPKKPIQIRVVSQTNVFVIASLGPIAGDRIVAPSKSVTFGRLHTSYLPLPLNLQVTLKETPTPDKPIRLFLNVRTSGNEIIVGVKTSLTGAGNSSQTINVDATGAIYLY